MARHDELDLGGLIVRCYRRHFVLQDRHDVGRTLVLENADIPALIEFLHEHSQRAKQELRLERLSKRQGDATNG